MHWQMQYIKLEYSGPYWLRKHGKHICQKVGENKQWKEQSIGNYLPGY
jgi:hypothetical protein